jgi:hypothetical protein
VAGAPRGIATTSSRGKVTVNWTPPAALGGTAVTGYRAEFFTAAKRGTATGKCTAAGTARTCVISSLKVGRTYYLTVTATNAVGVSAAPARIKVLVKR